MQGFYGHISNCYWLLGLSKLPLIGYYLVLLATAGLLATLCVQHGVVGLPSQQKTQIVRHATSGIVGHPFSG